MISPESSAFKAGRWRAILLTSFGGALEFYDFIIYGAFAAYLSEAFFPAQDPIASLVAAFAVFAVGYVSRPLGGLIFGLMGTGRAAAAASFSPSSSCRRPPREWASCPPMRSGAPRRR